MTTSAKFKVKGVIFDLGSTLIEYETIPWDELHLLCLWEGYKYLNSKGYVLPNRDHFQRKYEEVRDRYRNDARDSLKEWVIIDAIYDLLHSVGLDGGRKLAEDFFAIYYRLQSEGLFMFDDTVSTLKALKDRNLKIGLVSNTIYPPEYHVRELRRFDILKYFDFTIFSSEFGFRKPHPSIYEKAIGLAGIAASDLLFVGDRYIEDVDGPSGFGFNAVLKYREGREYPDPLPSHTTVVYDLSELPALLQD